MFVFCHARCKSSGMHFHSFFGLHLALCNYYNNIINMFNDMHTHTSDIHIVVKIFAFLSGCISVYVDCEN